MADESTKDPKKIRRYYHPDIFRNLHMLSPFDLLRNLHNELEHNERGMGNYIWGRDRPYRPLLLRRGLEFPHTNIFDEGEKLRIAIEIPGTTKQDIDLDMEEDLFRIHAKTKFEKCVEHSYFVHCEEREGEFTREIKLPIPVNPDDAKAIYKNDVLEIEVPKKRLDRKWKKIAIE
jgi:HSP20 family protein